jgi:hypothetical protein
MERLKKIAAKARTAATFTSLLLGGLFDAASRIGRFVLCWAVLASLWAMESPNIGYKVIAVILCLTIVADNFRTRQKRELDALTERNKREGYELFVKYKEQTLKMNKALLLLLEQTRDAAIHSDTASMMNSVIAAETLLNQVVELYDDDKPAV